MELRRIGGIEPTLTENQMKHKDKFEALMLRVNPPRKYSLTEAAIRPHPRFADL